MGDKATLCQSVPECAAGGSQGNTKDFPRPYWLFTLHNYNRSDINAIEKWCCANCAEYIYSEEIGNEIIKAPHLQGYLELKKKKRMSTLANDWSKLSNIPSWRWRSKDASRQDNIDYIMKENGKKYGSLVPDTISVEEPTKLKFLIDLMDNYTDDRKIHVVVDEVGGIGKTEFARWAVINYRRCIVTGGKAADMKNQIVEYKKNTTHTPKYIIIDVPRSNLNFLSYTGIEEVKNMLFYSGKYEGGMIVGNKPFVLMLMNEKPKFEKMSEDRWKVYALTGTPE